MNNTSKLLALLALVLLAAPRARAAGEVTGHVAGYVYDPTGAALSEVPLTLSGPTMQAPMSRSTGDDGRFDFDSVPTGEEYVLEVNVPGFTPIRQTGIKVRLGSTAIVDVHLTVMTEQATAQTYEIVEKSNPVMNPDTAQSSAVITSEKAATTPIFHQVEGMAQQVAGVGPGNRPSTRGGLSRHGKFYVDGLDTTDVTDGSITAPMNFDAVDNFQIITGGFDAQYNSMGMVTNAVTKTGSNKYQVDASVTLNPTWMSASPNYPANQTGVYSQYIDNPNSSAKTSFYSPVLNVAGPLIKDKLWFYASYQQNFSSRENAVSVLGINSNRPTDTTTSLGRVKFTWQATDKDRVSFGFNLDRNVINNQVGDSTVTDDAETKIHRGGEFVLVNWDHTISDSVLFQLQGGFTFKQSNQDPIHDDFTTPSHFDTNSRIVSQNADALFFPSTPGNFLHESKWRLQMDPTISWKLRAAGTHQFKAGVQTSFMIDQQVTGVSGDRRYTDRGGVCDETNPATFVYCSTRIDFVGNKGGVLDTAARVLNTGVFIQDRWTVNRRLTVIPGIRVDIGRLWGDPGYNQSGTGKFPVITNLAGIGPRLSATYDLFGDRKTLLIANYGRNNDVGNVFIAQHGNPALTQYTSRWQTSSQSFPNCVANPKATGCSVAGGLNGRSIPYHSLTNPQKPPNVDELLFGVHHEVAEETSIGVDLDYRHYKNMWADEDISTVWDASGTKILGYAPGFTQQVIEAKTPDSAYRKYAGMDLWAQGAPGRWDLLASYTLAYNWGTVGDYFDGYNLNPRMDRFYDGYVFDDRRHTLKGSIAYRTAFGLDLGARVQYRTGAALWESFSNPGDSSQRLYKTPRGTGTPISSVTNGPDFNDPNQWTDLRSPDQFNIDLQGRYNLGDALRLKQRLELIMLVVNVLNHGDINNYSSSFATTNNRFGTASSHFSPLQAELMLRFRN